MMTLILKLVVEFTFGKFISYTKVEKQNLEFTNKVLFVAQLVVESTELVPITNH